MDLDALRASFASLYGEGEPPRLFSAPGRVNLIGEHTDYNDGFVLPMAIDRRTIVAARVREDRVVDVFSKAVGEACVVDLDRPGPRRRGRWIDYVEGTAWALSQRGIRLRGAQMVIDSDVPLGAGLSSSAAIEIAVALSLASLAVERPPSGVELARAGQAAEHAYVGTRCGLMDQLAAALGQTDHALLIDCRSLEVTPVAFPSSRVVVLVCDTHVKHELASSEYNRRREECEAGAAALARVLPEVRALRDLSVAGFGEHQHRLDEPVRRRCRHVVSENERVITAAAALGCGDFGEVGRLMSASHRSLRDDYEVSCPELDCAVDAALGVDGVLGARMMGGGFGGSTVNLVVKDAVGRASEAISNALGRRFGIRPGIFVTRASKGAMEHR